MNLDKVISISGKPGLYRLLSQSTSGFIAEDLAEGRKKNIPATYNVSLLNNVAIYTITGEMPLAEIFSRIYKKEDGEKAISPKSSEKELRAYMEEILPDYDASRVYKSDLKKVFQWYNILLENNMISPLEPAVNYTTTSSEEE